MDAGGRLEAALRLDPGAAVGGVQETLRQQVLGTLKRRGLVVGLSGGVDSAVVAALAVAALGRERVLAVLMPERDSADESLALGREVAETFGIPSELEVLDGALTGLGCRSRQAEAIRGLFPDFEDGWRFKLHLPPVVESDRLNVFQLTVETPEGERRTGRLSAEAYRQLVAATNFKQRVRKTLEYYHADRLHYAVAGTPNRLEYDQGFFVKQGDGAADVKPIAHLYKTQVYQLAEFLGVPSAVRERPPTTDTFSLPQTQEEFFFALPYRQMDLCLYAYNQGLSPAEVARELSLTEEQVRRVFRDIAAQRAAARYLHAPPLRQDAA